MNCSCKNCTSFQKEFNKQEKTVLQIDGISSWTTTNSSNFFSTITRYELDLAFKRMAKALLKDLYK